MLLLGHNKAIVAIARNLLVAVWHAPRVLVAGVLTEGCTDRFAETDGVTRKLLNHAYRLGRANRPDDQAAAEYVHQQLDRLGLDADLTAIQQGSKTLAYSSSRFGNFAQAHRPKRADAGTKSDQHRLFYGATLKRKLLTSR